jgi:hypothetical protein
LNNIRRRVATCHTGKLFQTPYLCAAAVEMTANGFSKSGIYPLDRSMVRSHDFAIYVTEEDADSEQSTHKPTVS